MKLILNVLKYTALYYLFLAPEEKTLIQNEGTQALIEVGVGEIYNVNDKKVQNYIKESIAKMSNSIDSTTNDELAKKIEYIYFNGLSVEEGVQTIQEVFKTLSTTRSRTIVRTETIRAGTYATLTAWKGSGVVEKKQWYTALDERTCPTCLSMHGKIVNLDDDFAKEGSSIA
ncbi:MAG: phage head morphogenesis protein [Candidatus Peribacteria bacterium]|jgi:SPP1 gp7 family putative phage head morphogenesis protein|nr:phage head morphogenesis protein [Candidatus Peribacteria bacterium]